MLSFRGRSFRPTLWAFALAVAGAAAGVALGNWQSGRAAERRAQDAQRAAALARAPATIPASPVRAGDYATRHVRARGVFVSGHTILLDHRFRDRRVGYEVVTPLRLGESSMHVLVLRGWVPAGAPGAPAPEVPTPRGTLEVAGLALARLPQWYEPGGGGTPRGRVWQNLRIDAAREATGLALQPVILEQHSALADGLRRDWPRAGVGAERNEMYALQWYALAVLALALWLVLSFRRDAPAAD